MFIELITIVACTIAIYQASRGTTSQSAKIAIYALISCPLILVLL